MPPTWVKTKKSQKKEKPAGQAKNKPIDMHKITLKCFISEKEILESDLIIQIFKYKQFCCWFKFRIEAINPGLHFPDSKVAFYFSCCFFFIKIIWSLNAQLESWENSTPAQNGLYWVGGKDWKK